MRNSNLVSASEIASWQWCPESWRLAELGHEPENRAALSRGEKDHAERARFEQKPRAAISLGCGLIAAAVLVLAVVSLLRMP